MKFMSIREFRRSTAAVREKMEEDREIVLTSNGKPFALVTPIDPDRLDEELQAYRSARFQILLTLCQRRSVELGLDSMTMEEINAEIAASRRERATSAVAGS
jgi:antitoxin (DNA-binding transcriptional repressor) of toxin-antitoxin stability system